MPVRSAASAMGSDCGPSGDRTGGGATSVAVMTLTVGLRARSKSRAAPRTGSHPDLVPGAPDGERHAPAGLDVDEQRVAVWIEGGAGELIVEPGGARGADQPVEGDVPQLPVA